jgi:acylphosphatase
MRRVGVTVTGRVQGVFYRVSCAERARELGIGGWVRNGGEGSVQAAFEGPDAAIEAMLVWCRIGPRHAEVLELQVTEESPVGETTFRILA